MISLQIDTAYLNKTVNNFFSDNTVNTEYLNNTGNNLFMIPQ